MFIAKSKLYKYPTLKNKDWDGTSIKTPVASQEASLYLSGVNKIVSTNKLHWGKAKMIYLGGFLDNSATT